MKKRLRWKKNLQQFIQLEAEAQNVELEFTEESETADNETADNETAEESVEE